MIGFLFDLLWLCDVMIADGIIYSQNTHSTHTYIIVRACKPHVSFFIFDYEGGNLIEIDHF